jgi:hypothetical protein
MPNFTDHHTLYVTYYLSKPCTTPFMIDKQLVDEALQLCCALHKKLYLSIAAGNVHPLQHTHAKALKRYYRRIGKSHPRKISNL